MLGTATLSFARSSQLTYTAQKLYGAKLESTAYKNLLPIRTKSVITVESILRAKAAPYMNKVGYNSGAFYFERKLLPIRTKLVISVGRFTSGESCSLYKQSRLYQWGVLLRAKAAPYTNKVGYISRAFYFERKQLCEVATWLYQSCKAYRNFLSLSTW